MFLDLFFIVPTFYKQVNFIFLHADKFKTGGNIKVKIHILKRNVYLQFMLQKIKTKVFTFFYFIFFDALVSIVIILLHE